MQKISGRNKKLNAKVFDVLKSLFLANALYLKVDEFTVNVEKDNVNARQLYGYLRQATWTYLACMLRKVCDDRPDVHSFAKYMKNKMIDPSTTIEKKDQIF